MWGSGAGQRQYTARSAAAARNRDAAARPLRIAQRQPQELAVAGAATRLAGVRTCGKAATIAAAGAAGAGGGSGAAARVPGEEVAAGQRAQRATARAAWCCPVPYP